MKVNQETYSDNWDTIFKSKNTFDHLMIDKILTNEVNNSVPEKKVAVLLSGVLILSLLLLQQKDLEKK